MLEHPLFIGRQREQDLLSREFLKALSGQTHVGFISGEPGIGKTRLLTQFAQGAEKDGALILPGLSSEMEGMPPYLPFLEALGSYIRAAPLALLRKQIETQAPAEAIADLALHSLGAPLDTESAQTLYARSEGNPFFAEELLRGWQETRRLRRLPTTWKLDPPNEGEFPCLVYTEFLHPRPPRRQRVCTQNMLSGR